jgi:hypothetical protein
MNDMVYVREQMKSVIEDLNTGNIKPGVATEKSNAAGKMIQSVKAEIIYKSLRKENKIPVIKDMEDEKESTD